ncbi:unnamed protein product [Lepidochelys kempii]
MYDRPISWWKGSDIHMVGISFMYFVIVFWFSSEQPWFTYSMEQFRLYRENCVGAKLMATFSAVCAWKNGLCEEGTPGDPSLTLSVDFFPDSYGLHTWASQKEI